MLSPLLGAFLLTSGVPKKKAPPKPFPYILFSSRADKKGFSWITLKATRTGRTLWKRRVLGYEPSQVEWAKNHHALLIDDPGPSQFLIWLAGYPLLTVDYVTVPGPGRTDRYDYTMGLSWSPDGHRLLVSFGLSGMADMECGRMFCLSFKGTHYKYTVLPYPAYVRSMGWRSNRVAFFCPAEGPGGQKTGKPRSWRVPS